MTVIRTWQAPEKKAPKLDSGEYVSGKLCKAKLESGELTLHLDEGQSYGPAFAIITELRLKSRDAAWYYFILKPGDLVVAPQVRREKSYFIIPATCDLCLPEVEDMETRQLLALRPYSEYKAEVAMSRLTGKRVMARYMTWGEYLKAIPKERISDGTDSDNAQRN